MCRLLLVSLLFFLFFTAAGDAVDLFRWVDERGVIHFTDNLHNIPEQHRAKALRIKGREPPPAQEPIPAPLVDKVSVPIQKRGQVVVVAAIINEKTKANFVVDTGASYTMISRATAQSLQIDLEKKYPTVSLQTANGPIEAPLVSLESIEVGGMQVRDLTAAIHDVFPDATISGLLGLNFLAHFRMDIDTKSSVLVLEKK
jgi:clan AA aspartic protease (TIGR02281 family)